MLHVVLMFRLLLLRIGTLLRPGHLFLLVFVRRSAFRLRNCQWSGNCPCHGYHCHENHCFTCSSIHPFALYEHTCPDRSKGGATQLLSIRLKSVIRNPQLAGMLIDEFHEFVVHRIGLPCRPVCYSLSYTVS